MGADTDTATDDDSAADVGHDLDAERTTAPMGPYGNREVGYGIAFLVAGVTVAFALPLILTSL